ncbi:hypothetical protein SELMODRAFT_51938, partial [Selaginella moellendorffii]
LVRRCRDRQALEEGRRVHEQIRKNGFEGETFLGNLLVEMYAKCGSWEDARQAFEKIEHKNAFSFGTNQPVLGTAIVTMYGKSGNLVEASQVFDRLSSRNIITWNTLMGAYAQYGHPDEVLRLQKRMELEGVKQNRVTYLSLLDACSELESLTDGQALHARITATGYVGDAVLDSAVVNMYTKCKSLERARRVFDRMQLKTEVTWTTLISAYAQQGQDLENAREVFDRMTTRTVVTWNTLLTAYGQHGHSEEAIRLYQRMEPDGVEPDEITYVTIVGACGDMQSLAEGRPVHDRIVRAGLENGALVSTALVSMYGKCGSLDEARKIFDGSDLSNLVSWNAMIVAYAQNGEGKQGLELYELMNLGGVEPNGVTYTGVLFACAHAGLLDEAWKQFVSLKTDRGIEWEDEHFSCMTDMLGRLGRLEEAEEFLKRFPQAGGVPWLSLLNSCQMHGDLERGKRVSQEAMKRNPETSSSYVMLSNIYA